MRKLTPGGCHLNGSWDTTAQNVHGSIFKNLVTATNNGQILFNVLEYLLARYMGQFGIIGKAPYSRYIENKNRSIPGPSEMAPPVYSHLANS